MFKPPIYRPDKWFWTLRSDGRVYSSEARGYVSAVPEGRPSTMVADEADLLAALQMHAPEYLPPGSPAAQLRLREEIRREADRRIQIAIGARTPAHADEALRTAALTSSAILAKKTAGIPLSPEEQFAEGMYAFMFMYIRAVKATQNQLEAELNEDYVNDARWPAPVSP